MFFLSFLSLSLCFLHLLTTRAVIYFTSGCIDRVTYITSTRQSSLLGVTYFTLGVLVPAVLVYGVK